MSKENNRVPIPMLTSEQNEYFQENFPSMVPDYPTEALKRNFNTIQRWLPFWFSNLRENGSLISKGFNEGRFCSLAHIASRLRHRDLTKSIVVGSGPSANQLLKCDLKSWDGLVICGSSNASLLAAAGRPADIIFAVDSNESIWLQLKTCPHETNGSILVTHPYIHPKVLTLWERNICFYHSHIPYGNHPFNTFCEHLYPMIEGFMIQSGCTVNQEVTFHTFLTPSYKTPWVTKKIFLSGVDFSYPSTPNGFNERCNVYRYVNGDYILQPPSSPRSPSKLTYYNGRLTDSSQMGYKNSLLVLYKLMYYPLFDCSDGILTELPKADIQEVVASKGSCVKTTSFEEIHARWLHYVETNKTKDEEGGEGEKEELDSEVLSRLEET
jgi:hypothetical protein